MSLGGQSSCSSCGGTPIILTGRYVYMRSVDLYWPCDQLYWSNDFTIRELRITYSDNSCASCPANTFNSFNTTSKDISTCWCVPGSYYASSKCNLCERGKFWSSGQCSNCPAGTFSNVSGATNSSACAACLPGTYSAAGSSACTPCPANSSSPSSSTAIAACRCPQGFTGPDAGVCVACVAGKYKSATGSVACTSCAAGTFSASDGASECALCPATFTSLVGSASAGECGCPENTYTVQSAATASVVTEIADIQWKCNISELSPVLVKDPVDYEYGYDMIHTNLCSTKYYKSQSRPDRNKNAIDTDDGIHPDYDTYITLEDDPNCPWLRIDLEVSQYISSFAISAADTSTFDVYKIQVQIGDVDAVNANPICGTYTVSEFAHEEHGSDEYGYDMVHWIGNKLSCASPMYGRYFFITILYLSGDTTCQVNPDLDHKMQISAVQINSTSTQAVVTTGQTQTCGACPAGTSSVFVPGVKDVSKCWCPPGLYYQVSSSLCVSCAAGKFWEAGQCSECPVSTYSSVSGALDCTACPAGTYSDVAGLSVCKGCPVDTYSMTVGASGSGVCLSCPVNTVSAAGTAVIGGCLCAFGYTGPNGGPCISCEVGKYKMTTGSAVCTDCPAQSYSWTLGSNSSTACVCNEGYTGPDGGPCLACVSGTFKPDTGSSACTLCPNNTFSELPARTNASVCEACQDNAVSAAGSVSQEYCYCVPGYAHLEGRHTCRECTPGTYNSQLGRRACSNCTIGMYSVNYSAISPETCKYCPAGQWSPEGSANCNLCPANSRTLGVSGLITDCVCNHGYTGPSGSTCVACAAGLYKDVTGPDVCTACPALMSSFPGTERAADCWCVPGYVKVSGVCVEMIPRVTQITGTLKDITSDASPTEIQNATEKLRINVAAQLNIAIELVQVDLVQNSSNQVQVLLFARSETEVALLEQKVRFAREPPRPTLLPFLLVPIGNSSVGEPRVVLITVDIHHEARFASRESEMLFAVTEGMSENLDVAADDISYVFDESMDMDIPRVIMSVRTPTYDEYVRVLAAAYALLAQGNVIMPEMTVQVLTVGDAGPSGLNATYALIRQDGAPMAGHEVSAANETLVRQLSWYYDVPAYDVSVIERKLENICFKNTSY